MKNKYFTKEDVYEIIEIVITAISSVIMLYILTVVFWSYQ